MNFQMFMDQMGLLVYSLDRYYFQITAKYIIRFENKTLMEKMK